MYTKVKDDETDKKEPRQLLLSWTLNRYESRANETWILWHNAFYQIFAKVCARSGTRYPLLLSIAFFASSYPAKFIAPRGAIQKNLGTAPLKRPRGPSWVRMEKATICIETGRPCGAVIILVFITSKGVVTTAARPPESAPTAIVSQGSSSRLRRLWAAYKSN